MQAIAIMTVSLGGITMTYYQGVSLDERWKHLMEIRQARKKATQELKSRVMSLGNRLAKGQDRSAAFLTAWAIVKAGGLTLPVKGTSFGNRQEALKRLATYSPEQIKTLLVPEPENPADPAAVAVMVGVQNGRGLYRLGYLPRGQGAFATVFKAVSLKVLNGDIRGARITLAA